jgi:dipeptidyl aminopeptidase/acylaminoacyl peptidase
MAASLLAVERRDLRAVVLCAGIYDFAKEYGETQIPGIRGKMDEETKMTPAAVRERSSILRMDKLRCPVLILHGERDDRVPVSQALMLRDRLAQLHKEFEIRLFPDRGHDVGSANVVAYAADFFKRKLAAGQKLPDAPPPPNSPPPPR